MPKRKTTWLALSAFTLSSLLALDISSVNAQEIQTSSTQEETIFNNASSEATETITQTPAEVISESTTTIAIEETLIPAEVEVTTQESELAKALPSQVEGLSTSIPQQTATTTTAPTLESYIGYNKYNRVNYRDAQAQKFVGQLTLGAKVEGTIEGFWINFMKDGQAFKIAKSVLSDNPIAYTGYNKYERVNYRNAQSMSFAGQLSLGAKVQGTIEDLWINFSKDGQAFKIAKSVLSDNPIAYTGYNKFNGANYRDTQATKYIGKLSLGEKITGTIDGPWITTTRNGQTIKVSKSLLSDKPVASQLNVNNISNKRMDFWFRKAKAGSGIRSTLDPTTLAVLNQYDSIWIGPNTKDIYLTMDLGYEMNTNTTQILDIAKKNNIKITFFLTDRFLKQVPNVVKRMVNEGHVVANHTMNHQISCNVLAKSQAQYVSEVVDLEKNYRNVTGKELAKFIRPPEGTYSPKVLAVNKSLGYRTVFWSYAHLDWDPKKQPDPTSARINLESHLHNGQVLLLHTLSTSNVKLLDTYVQHTKAKGYQFKTLNQMPN